MAAASILDHKNAHGPAPAPAPAPAPSHSHSHSPMQNSPSPTAPCASPPVPCVSPPAVPAGFPDQPVRELHVLGEGCTVADAPRGVLFSNGTCSARASEHGVVLTIRTSAAENCAPQFFPCSLALQYVEVDGASTLRAQLSSFDNHRQTTLTLLACAFGRITITEQKRAETGTSETDAFTAGSKEPETKAVPSGREANSETSSEANSEPQLCVRCQIATGGACTLDVPSLRIRSLSALVRGGTLLCTAQHVRSAEWEMLSHAKAVVSVPDPAHYVSADLTDSSELCWKGRVHLAQMRVSRLSSVRVALHEQGKAEICCTEGAHVRIRGRADQVTEVMPLPGIITVTKKTSAAEQVAQKL